MSRLLRWAWCDVEVERTRATNWSATRPFQSPLISSIGGNGASGFVTVNSLPWLEGHDGVRDFRDPKLHYPGERAGVVPAHLPPHAPTRLIALPAGRAREE
jgi:hypothetical protein